MKKVKNVTSGETDQKSQRIKKGENGEENKDPEPGKICYEEREKTRSNKTNKKINKSRR